jgi:molybdopterin converting factor small subunit
MGMRVSVRYMTQLRTATGTAAETVDVEAPCTAADLVAQIAAHHGAALRRLLLDADGRLHPAILVFVGDVQDDPRESVPLKEGDVVTLLAPVAGG